MSEVIPEQLPKRLSTCIIAQISESIRVSFPALFEFYRFLSNLSSSLINRSSYLPTFLLNQSNQPLPCLDHCLNLRKHKRAFLNFLSKLAWVISLQSQKTCEFPEYFFAESPHIEWVTPRLKKHMNSNYRNPF